MATLRSQSPPDTPNLTNHMIYDAVIIGGGVVGLSILRSSLLAGYDAVLLEKNDHLCDGASGRNSGVFCTGVDAAPGSLERALIRDSISRVREFCHVHNVPVRDCGSLVCLWPWDDDGDLDGDVDDGKKMEENEEEGRDASTSNSGVGEELQPHPKLRRILRDSHIAGDNDARYFDADSVSKLEPSLSSLCRGAVQISGEIVVDPWLFPLALAAHSRELAKRPGKSRDESSSNKDNKDADVIRTGWEVDMGQSSFNAQKGLWTLVARRANGAGDDKLMVLTARSVINAAGINADSVQRSASCALRNDEQNCCLSPPKFEARPRRGQYIVYSIPSDEKSLSSCAQSNSPWAEVPRTVPTRPIQPVPTERTKGIFVYSTLYDQIVVGPTAKDQTSRSDFDLDPDVASTLAAHASRILGRPMGTTDDPVVGGCNVVGEYVGIRPGTSERDYQIRLHPRSNFITVGGIRSTGLTGSLGIGRHVVQCLLSAVVEPPDMSRSEETNVSVARPTPLPAVNVLAEQYHRRGDGSIVVNGHSYKVTHPLTRMGWDARTGIAAS